MESCKDGTVYGKLYGLLNVISLGQENGTILVS